MNFGDRLREARISKQLTQEQLASLVGIAKSTLTGYEKGNREPDFFKLNELIRVLGVDPNFLLKDETKMPAEDGLGGLSEGEAGLIRLFRLVPEDQQAMVLSMIEAALKSRGLL